MELELKWQKWIFDVDFAGEKHWIGSFDTADEARAYATKHFPRPFIGQIQMRKNLCGRSIQVTKKFWLPKKITGYIITDWRGRLFDETELRRGNRRAESELLAFHARNTFRCKKGAKWSHDQPIQLHANRASMVEKVACYRPTASEALKTEFLAVAKKSIDPACRLFEIECKVADCVSDYHHMKVQAFTVKRELIARESAMVYKEHREFYRKREALEDKEFALMDSVMKLAKDFLTEPKADKVRAMCKLAATGEVIARHYSASATVTKSVQALTEDAKFMDRVTAVLPLMSSRGSVGVMRGMIAVSTEFRGQAVAAVLK